MIVLKIAFVFMGIALAVMGVLAIRLELRTESIIELRIATIIQGLMCIIVSSLVIWFGLTQVI